MPIVLCHWFCMCEANLEHEPDLQHEPELEHEPGLEPESGHALPPGLCEPVSGR